MPTSAVLSRFEFFIDDCRVRVCAIHRPFYSYAAKQPEKIGRFGNVGFGAASAAVNVASGG